MKAGIPVNVILFDLEATLRMGAGILDNISSGGEDMQDEMETWGLNRDI